MPPTLREPNGVRQAGASPDHGGQSFGAAGQHEERRSQIPFRQLFVGFRFPHTDLVLKLKTSDLSLQWLLHGPLSDHGGFAVTDFVFGFQADSRLASWFPADSGHTKPNPKRRGGLDGARPTTKAGPKEETKTRLDNRLRVRKRVMSEKVLKPFFLLG
jgi:hypothetical protein